VNTNIFAFKIIIFWIGLTEYNNIYLYFVKDLIKYHNHFYHYEVI